MRQSHSLGRRQRHDKRTSGPGLALGRDYPPVSLNDFLAQLLQDKYSTREEAPLGEALQEILAHADLRKIPVVVMTTSDAKENISRCYEIGANSYIVKPITHEGLVKAIKLLGQYWLEMVELP